MQGQQYQYILQSKAVLRSRSRGFFSWSRSQYFGSAPALNLFFCKVFPFLGQNIGLMKLFFIKIKNNSMFCTVSNLGQCLKKFNQLFFGAEAGWSQYFLGGAGAEFFYPELESKINLEPEPGKNEAAPHHMVQGQQEKGLDQSQLLRMRKHCSFIFLTNPSYCSCASWMQNNLEKQAFI